ncbi:MAG: putative multidrug export ATP-binding/permease protein [Firmicutes bacterium ADurb.Bin080]|jgi:ATP-binding cassette, subfamily B, multidrug efflux pump|nr:ABC transporter ATP-binding protein [Clostridiales bacterium]OQC14983.1 MAG: putative multidrug export ATP-binding/permease protein [Firmicutes bacterium ADurb.Bin080]
MWRKLFSNVNQYKKYAILAPLFVVLEVVCEVLIPKIMTYIIDDGVAKGNINAVLINGGIMVILAGLSLLLGLLSARFAAVASMGFGANLRENMFNKVQNFSFKNVDKFSTGSLITRFTTDVSFVQQAFMMSIRIAFRAPVMLILSIVMIFTINIKIAIAFVVLVPLVWGLMIFAMKFVVPLFEKLFKKFDALNTKVQENLTGIRVVKTFVRENHESASFRKASLDLQDAQIKAEKLLVYANPLMNFVTYAITITVVWIGGIQIMQATMSAGDISGIIAYIGQLLMALVMVAMVFVNLFMSRASARRISEIIDETPDISDKDADPSVKVEDSNIIFDKVSFKYKEAAENPVLSDISFEVKKGEVLGIVGGTGSGKSSLVQLIPRLYDASQGNVLVGGRNVKEFKIETLREAVGMVLQNNTLFSGTIEENLRWGNPNATQEELEEACKIASAHDFIVSFPNGYKSDISQGGVNVSGGQKQRICIARALLKKPKVLILDDSTSAVDSATEAEIREGIKASMKETTLIVIAQRIASVIDADKIIVLDDGKINGIGTHKELLQNNNIYKEIYNSQLGGVR